MEIWEAMEEREFFNETTEQRTHTLTCPKCGQEGEYKVTWVVRRKRAQLPRGADERDRARFAKAQSYMVRRDDKLACANIRCRKAFEISSLQSVAFLWNETRLASCPAEHAGACADAGAGVRPCGM